MRRSSSVPLVVTFRALSCSDPQLRDRFNPDAAAIPDITVKLVPLSAYDELAIVAKPCALEAVA